MKRGLSHLLAWTRKAFAWMNEPVETPESTAVDHWSLPTRFGFRLVFIYFLLYLFCNGCVTIFNVIPGVGDWIRIVFATPFAALAQILGALIFHLKGLAMQWHGGGSGDTALDYVRIFVFALFALAGAVIWSLLDRRHRHHQVLYAWLRFLIRLTLGLSMLVYGFSKLFPIQMQPPSLAILNENYGQSSPMTLLWTLIGSSPGYEMVCGLAEVTGGFLILLRRTALCGALLTAFVMTNVVLYNFFFDVPVKIFSCHLLLLALFVVLPDVTALWSFFILHRPAYPTGVWIPPASRRGFKMATSIFEVFFLVWCFWAIVFSSYTGWKAYDPDASLVATPLTGIWQVDNVQPIDSPYLMTRGGNPWTTLCIDSVSRAFLRSTDGQLWRCSLDYNATKRTLELDYVGYGDLFSWKLVDADHLELAASESKTVNGEKAKVVVATIYLHRVPTPADYPLLKRGFHWISEWGYER